MTTDKLSEMDRLKLTLAKEKQGRLQAEATNLQMLQRQLQAQHAAIEAENKAFFDSIKGTYDLKDGDQVGEDGTIKRAAAQAEAAPTKEG